MWKQAFLELHIPVNFVFDYYFFFQTNKLNLVIQHNKEVYRAHKGQNASRCTKTHQSASSGFCLTSSPSHFRQAWTWGVVFKPKVTLYYLNISIVYILVGDVLHDFKNINKEYKHVTFKRFAKSLQHEYVSLSIPIFPHLLSKQNIFHPL